METIEDLLKIKEEISLGVNALLSKNGKLSDQQIKNIIAGDGKISDSKKAMWVPILEVQTNSGLSFFQPVCKRSEKLPKFNTQLLQGQGDFIVPKIHKPSGEIKPYLFIDELECGIVDGKSTRYTRFVPTPEYATTAFITYQITPNTHRGDDLLQISMTYHIIFEPDSWMGGTLGLSYVPKTQWYLKTASVYRNDAKNYKYSFSFDDNGVFRDYELGGKAQNTVNIDFWFDLPYLTENVDARSGVTGPELMVSYVLGPQMLDSQLDYVQTFKNFVTQIKNPQYEELEKHSVFSFTEGH